MEEPVVPSPPPDHTEPSPDDPPPSSSMSGSEPCDDSLLGSNETPLSSTPGTPKSTGGGGGGGLSRRQRKNRKRDKIDPSGSKNKKVSKSPIVKTMCPEEISNKKVSSSGASLKSRKRSMPCKQYLKLNLDDQDIYYYLSTYISPIDQLRQLGFPMDSSLYPGKSYIYRDPEFCSIFPDGENCDDDDVDFNDAASGRTLFNDANGGRTHFNAASRAQVLDSDSRQFLDVNAREFVPSSSKCQEDGPENFLEGGSTNEKAPSPGEASLTRPAVEGVSESTSSTGSDSEMGESGWSDRQANRKRSIDDISGIPLNATAKEFVPSNVSNTRTSKPSPASSPATSKIFSGTLSSPNLYEGASNKNTPPPLISAASSVILRPDSLHRNSSSSTGCEPPELPSEEKSANQSNSTVDDKTSSSVASSSRVLNNNQEKVEERKCVRCKKGFLTSAPSGDYVRNDDRCSYHWGKLRSKNKNEPEFTCCGGKASKAGRGCTAALQHVWTGLPSGGGMTGPLDGFVKTKHRKAARNYGVYGLDCEMVYTGLGLELVKVTVVGVDGRLVYESLVMPENDIIDYNTRFSGITQKDLEKGQKKNLKEVQNDLMGFINADTILMGHGLENDLRALKLIHAVVIDTSVVFPHFYGLPFRRSLRSLVSSYLKRDIQSGSGGHDSYEDARACVELMLWKTRKDVSSSKITEKLVSGVAKSANF